MTAKEKLHERVEALSEDEAERWLRAVEGNGGEETQPPFSLIGAFRSGRGDLSERASSDEFESGDAYDSQPSR